jgi:hypothetical protein
LLSLQTIIASLFPVIAPKLSLVNNAKLDASWFQNQFSDDIDLNDDSIAFLKVFSSLDEVYLDANELFNAIIR